MAHPTAVINVVGLSRSLMGRLPSVARFADHGASRVMTPVLPAVTCSAQSTMLTGVAPSEHGIVGNGWYDREACEVKFWKQSNRLVKCEKVWESARRRDESVTCLNMFWWYNMYSSADYSVTPRPMYKADGRKVPDCYSEPPELRDELQRELGRFPLFRFWGPGASIESTSWIASATMRVWDQKRPTLSLVYLPHLDYSLQKLGPEHPDIARECAAIDSEVARLLVFFKERHVRVIIVSEYGISPVSRPVEINRVLRREGLIQVREEDGLELLDAGASDAFAVCDHQLAHVYVREPDTVRRVADACRQVSGVERVLTGSERAEVGLDHERSGDIVLVSEHDAWFAYPYWLDDARAPDFARTVDIHRKPGYDPCELFIDPRFRFPKLAVASRLLRKKLGFRTLMDVIPLDASLVRGSHGRADVPDELKPVLLTERDYDGRPSEVAMASVRDVILEHLFED